MSNLLIKKKTHSTCSKKIKKNDKNISRLFADNGTKIFEDWNTYKLTAAHTGIQENTYMPTNLEIYTMLRKREIYFNSKKILFLNSV